MHKPDFQSVALFCELSHNILQHANKEPGKIAFIKNMLKILSDFSQCDAIELREKQENTWLCYGMTLPQHSFQINCVTETPEKNHRKITTFFSQTHNDSFWTNNLSGTQVFHYENALQNISHHIQENYSSLALLPIIEGNQFVGLLLLKSRQKNFFSEDEISFYENLCKMIATASGYRLTQSALHERIKEMTCIHEMNKIVQIENISLEEILQKVVEILPPAWQYPEITHARIILDQNCYVTKNFSGSAHKLSSDIVISGEKRGCIEIFYTIDKLEIFFSHDRVFLPEELYLIRAIAQQLALTIEQRQTKEEKSKLQEQLRHSDRLATIGQLAAGVAHELNEPLVHILGFAQLTLKIPQLPTQARDDINKILKASLHAREIIKKLLLFSRQTQTKKIQVDLNSIVEEGMYFLEARCAKHRITVVNEFTHNLPTITADPSQLHQVVINLIVNSIHAMPQGGKIIIKTLASDNKVSLILQDTGTGISDEVQQKIFLPFFTTKDVGEGTGLGLAVVHGIVTSHKGTIEVTSKINHGTQFAINFPISNDQKQRFSVADN